MPEPPRTQRYEGLFQSQTQELFEADARSAAEHDWYPASENWTGPVLFVVYEHDPGRRRRAPDAARPPVPASVKAPKWDGSARTGRGRRVMLGAGIGLAVVAVVVVTMVGSQLLGGSAGDGQQSGGDPAATPSAQAVVVVPTALLGSRATAVDLFRERGYSGVLAPLVDGRERWRATDKRSSVAEVIGPEDRITEVSLAVRIQRDEKRNNKARTADLEFLFTSFAPLAAEWAVSEVAATDQGMARSSEQRFDGLLVRLVSMPVKGGAVLKFQIMAD